MSQVSLGCAMHLRCCLPLLLSLSTPLVPHAWNGMSRLLLTIRLSAVYHCVQVPTFQKKWAHPPSSVMCLWCVVCLTCAKRCVGHVRGGACSCRTPLLITTTSAVNHHQQCPALHHGIFAALLLPILSLFSAIDCRCNVVYVSCLFSPVLAAGADEHRFFRIVSDTAPPSGCL